MNNWIVPAISLLTMLASGGLLGVYFSHRRLAPVSAADVADRDWKRFQDEIGRLLGRVVALEREAETFRNKLRECEDRESSHNAKITRLQAIIDQSGEFRQLAQNIVSAERNEGLQRPTKSSALSAAEGAVSSAQHTVRTAERTVVEVKTEERPSGASE